MRNTIKQLLLPSMAVLCLAAASPAESMSNSLPAAPAAAPVPLDAKAGVVPDRMEPVTDKFQRDTAGVGITEHLGSTVPLETTFTDSTGREVTLGDYFRHGKPVILQLGYFSCPMLCDKVSEALMDGVRDLKLQMGTDYDTLYVSVNPNERWSLGQSKKRTYVEEYGKPGAAAGWNFLVGHEPSIKALADAVGFGYRKVESRDEYSHPPMVVILTADGKISRYFYGFQFPSEQLRVGLVEAGQGKVGSYVEQIVVALCYHYDEYAGKYSWSSMFLMRSAAVLTVLTVLTVLGSLWVRDAKSPAPPATS